MAEASVEAEHIHCYIAEKNVDDIIDGLTGLAGVVKREIIDTNFTCIALKIENMPQDTRGSDYSFMGDILIDLYLMIGKENMRRAENEAPNNRKVNLRIECDDQLFWYVSKSVISGVYLHKMKNGEYFAHVSSYKGKVFNNSPAQKREEIKKLSDMLRAERAKEKNREKRKFLRE